MLDDNINSLLQRLTKSKFTNDGATDGGQILVPVHLLNEALDRRARDYSRKSVVEYIDSLVEEIRKKAEFPALKVMVKDGQIFVYKGICRLRAARLAIEQGYNIPGLYCVVISGDELAKTLAVLGDDGKGLPLTPCERAEIYSQLIALGLDIESIAKRIKHTKTHVRQMLRLHSVPVEVKTLVNDNSISWTLAIDTHADYGDRSFEVLELAGQNKQSRKIKSSDVSALAGYRSTFSSALIRKVTNVMSDLEGLLEQYKGKSEGATLQLDQKTVNAIMDVCGRLKNQTSEPEL